MGYFRRLGAQEVFQKLIMFFPTLLAAAATPAAKGAAKAAAAAPAQSHTALYMFLGFVARDARHHLFQRAQIHRLQRLLRRRPPHHGWQNGLAVAGDYMSAASFLGIAGMIAFYGYDGFMYSVGWLVAYLTVLLIVAEPLRNAGKYTMADLLAYRLKPRPVRAMASLSTLTVSTFYMIAQMVGAGALVKLLLPGVHFNCGDHRRGRAHDRLCGLRRHARDDLGADHQGDPAHERHDLPQHPGDEAFRLQLRAVLRRDQPSPSWTRRRRHDEEFFPARPEFGDTVTNAGWGPLDLISLGLALVFGTAGLPHILVRFYTVPDAKTARVSVVWAMVIIGIFYIMTTFLGFGAATILDAGKIMVDGVLNENMAAPLLAKRLGGEVFFAFISAVAFATILAVVAGLTISASTCFAHDFYTNVIHHGKEHRPGEEVRVARITAFVVGAVAILLAIKLQTVNVAFLVGLAFAVAASANLPVIVLLDFLAPLQHRRRGRRASASVWSPASC